MGRSCSPSRGSSIHRKADRPAQDLRRPGRHRHRKRAALQGIQERNASLREALEHQTATSEVLRVIASSPTELQPVLDTLIANAVRLSGATKGHVRQFDGEFHRVVAHYGETGEMIAILRANPLPASPELPAARALVGGKPIHILDVQAETACIWV